jgi:protein-disulfide isomerase
MSEMNEIIRISRWFYPAGISLHVWLTALAVFAFLLVIARWCMRGGLPKWTGWAATLLAMLGLVACFVMTEVEIFLFDLSSPVSVAAYAALAVAFAWIIGLSRTCRPLRLQAAGAFLLTAAALTCLFPFAAFPRIVELGPEALQLLEGSNVRGSQSALLLTEFADFQCAPCAMQDEVIERLWQKYPDRIRHSFRHLPLSRRHPQARAAALASQCAAAEGQFWETRRLLFANQERLREILSRPVLPTISAVDAQDYEQCIHSESAWEVVRHDLALADQLGIRATPSILIGNKLIVGLTRLERLEFLVHRELAAQKLPEPAQANRNPAPVCGSALSNTCAEWQGAR